MAEEIPKIPKATNLFISSGNIVNWNRLKRKPTQSPTEELSECLSSTLKLHLENADATELQYETELSCIHKKFNETIPEGERGDLKLTVKIYLCSFLDPKVVEEAIEIALKQLDTTFIDTVLLAFPELESGEITPDHIKPYWNVLEKLVKSEPEKVLLIGVADLDKNSLEQLCDSVEIKPVVNQVNLESCCVMPKDLVEYAKLNEIQLLTHNDPRDLIPIEKFQGVIREVSTEKDSEGWEPQWVLRYSTLMKCRGIIKSKGYLLKAIRERKRK